MNRSNEQFLQMSGQTFTERCLLLAIDDISLPLRRNLTLHLNRPSVRAEPVLKPRCDDLTMPDNLATLFYGTVLHEGGRYRMWYTPVGRGPDPAIPPELLDPNHLDGAFTRGPICYAESDDGVNWHRPVLSQCSYKGNTRHNGLAMGFDSVSGAAIICDELDPDLARRYKAIFSYYIYTGPDACASLGGATSADGVHWLPGPLKPLRGDFFEATGFHRYGEMYVAIGQKGGPHYSEGGNYSTRQGRAHVSYDFEDWSIAQAEALLLPEPADPELRSSLGDYDQVHVGIGSRVYNNVTIGLYGLWHNAVDYRDITCDLGLAISNDGLHFREPVKGMPYLSHQSSPIFGDHPLAAKTRLTQGNGIVNVGDQTLIYHGRWNDGGMFGHGRLRNGGYDLHLEYLDQYYAEIALASIERDRWGALGVFADSEEGHVWSLPVRLPERMDNFHLSLNATGVAGISVEVGQENLRSIPGFRNGQCSEGDGLASPVYWPDVGLAALAGETVRFRVNMQRRGGVEPRLYALNIGLR